MLTERPARPGTKETVQDLWEAYHASGDKNLRDRLVLSLSPMVKYIVYRKVRELPPECELEDFISCGLEALMRSIDRYDPSRGATLEQFVWTRIHGAVLDELRHNDWAPRSVRRWEREISVQRDKFALENGRPPTRDELGDVIGIGPDALDRHLADIHRADVGSLNTAVTTDDETSLERLDTIASSDPLLDPESQLLSGDLHEQLQIAFSQLSAREQQVAIRLYVDEMTLREVGELLGVTESRVCQIHSQLRKHLRELLTEAQVVPVS